MFTAFLRLQVFREFFRRPRAANSAVHCPVMLYLELSPDVVVVLVTCKNEEDSIKNEGARVFTTVCIDFSHTRAAYSVICERILPKFELIQAFMHDLVTCKNEEDPIKNEGAITRFLPLYVYGNFSRCSRAANSAIHGRMWSNFKPIRDFMVVLVTCKNAEDPIKNEGTRVFTTLYINFSDAQGR